MRKGQMFSLDFLIAIGIVILVIGTILLVAEKKNYEQTESFMREKLMQKTSNGINNLFASREYSCVLGEKEILYSLDINKLVTKRNNLKNTIGLSDYNVNLTITDSTVLQIFNDGVSKTEAYAIDLNILTCIDSNKLSYLDLFDCKDGNCYSANLKSRKLKIMVSQ